jgi:hypothetical protein
MSHCLHRLFWASLLTLAATAGPGNAQPTSVPAPELSLRFHNGSVVHQALLLDSVEMETKLGKLTIPASEIQRINFGFRLSEEDDKKVGQALRDLANEKHAARDTAAKTLLSMGQLAYPALLESRKGGDLETTRRVGALLKDIQDRVPADDLLTRRTDIIRTSDSTLSGQITSAALRVRCEIFGEVKIPLWRLRDLYSTVGELSLVIDSSKYGNKTSWMPTEFDATLGTRVEISASGEINLDPTGMLLGPGVRGVPEGTAGLNSGEGYAPGQLLGRIGADGPAFVIRRHYTFTPSREGKLFLRIVTIEHANNVKAEGTYKVRIAAEPTPVLNNFPAKDNPQQEPKIKRTDRP